MSARFFLDTNVFVYTFDGKNPAKQAKARKLIEQALAKNAGFVSTQVIQEFLNVAMRKFDVPLSTHEGKVYLDQVLAPLCEVFPSMDLYRRALDIKSETRFSFYDSLIVASAQLGGAKAIYTEDLQANRQLAGLTIINPF